MIRFGISMALFLLAFITETSFFASLPSVFATVPLVFAIGVYLIQHQGRMAGLIWILSYGLLVQTLHTSTYPLPLVAYGAGGFTSLIAAKHLFSNRSLYGVVACAWVGFASFVITQACILFVAGLGESSSIPWSVFWIVQSQGFLVLTATMTVIFLVSSFFRSPHV